METLENSEDCAFDAVNNFYEHDLESCQSSSSADQDGIFYKKLPSKSVNCESKEVHGEICEGGYALDFWVELKTVAKHIYNMRAKRKNIFSGSDLFGEPSWDILLDLFIRQIEGKSTSITSSCIGSGVAHTTALRWIKVLEGRGFLERSEDPSDGRRVYLRLTPNSFMMMSQYIIEFKNGL